MKNFLILFICLNFCFANAYTDDFVQNSLNGDLKIKPYKAPFIIDDFAKGSLNKNLKIKPYIPVYVVDDFALENLNPNLKIKSYSPPFIDDNFANENLDRTLKIKKYRYRPIREFDRTVSVKIKKYLTTKTKPKEGTPVEFETVEPLEFQGITYGRGQNVRARIETISQNTILGVPSHIVIGNFVLENIELTGEISKTGANRALWVYPSVYFGSWFFGAGLLLIPVRGGHAKIRTNEKFNLYLQTDY